MVSLFSAECELYAAVNTTSEGSGLLSAGEGLGHCMWVEPTSGCDDVLRQPPRAGQGKTRRHAQVKEVRHEGGGHEREPRRLDDETTSGTKDRAAYENHGL